jgi:stage V sporulation protein R
MEYIEDPSIGIEKVERIIDAVHAIQFQTYRWPINRKKHSELKKEYESLVKNDKTGEYRDFNLNKFPLEPDYDLLGFISEYSKNLSSWEKDIVNIVREESHYFIPQIKTKVINEGWASFWHYKLMNELKLPQKYHIPFLKSHNQVIRPHIGAINPYHLGFHIFKKIEEKHGLERCFFAREICHDQSFIREYLELEDGIDLNLFTYSKKKNYYSIDDISNEDDWKEVKNTLINNVGMSTIPRIFVEEVENSDTLILSHEHEGRDLEIQYANKVVEHIKTLWGDNVKLFTIVEDEAWIID